MKSSLPESISPCSNVRRSCSSLMNHEPCFTIQSSVEEEGSNDDTNNGQRSVLIDKEAMNQLSTKITQSLLHKLQHSNVPSSLSSSISSSNQNQDNQIVNECIENLNFASWDADGWHYTGTKYTRSNTTSTTTTAPAIFSPTFIEQQQRFERVALYVMVMDCINFCFWPVDDDDNAASDSNHKCSSSDNTSEMINMLEYEHLAIALKCVAERDDDNVLINDDTNNNKDSHHRSRPTTTNNDSNDDVFIVRAEDSYALAPQNLIHLNEELFLEMMMKDLPTTTTATKNQIFSIPNAKERVRLIIEMAQSLLSFHNGSATCFIAKADKSADRLVHLILQYFPGFRDTALCNCSISSSNVKTSIWVAFYKRAQILVADLWAALGKNRSQQITSGVEKVDATTFTKQETQTSLLDYCDFVDMEKITTFADYRVPQLLRHLGVLIYSPKLSQKVDSKTDLQVFSAHELYIRAATVVAVDQLVEMVKTKLEEDSNGSTMIMEFSQSVNAVKMDWYLWNIGEKLDRSQSLGNHHRVRTIFY